jgi:hypothetical protein
MTLELWQLGGVLLLNVVLGALLVVGVFAFMERRVTLGAAGGILVGAALIYAQATLGETWLNVTVAEMKLLVLAAAVGAVVGVVGVVLAVEPELDPKERAARERRKAAGR